MDSPAPQRTHEQAKEKLESAGPAPGSHEGSPAIDPAEGAVVLEDETFHMRVDADLPMRLERILEQIGRSSGAAGGATLEGPPATAPRHAIGAIGAIGQRPSPGRDSPLCALCGDRPATPDLPYRIAIRCTHRDREASVSRAPEG